METQRSLTDLGGFSHVEYWIFDLDNTLYSSDTNIFPQISENISLFVADFLKVGRAEADKIKTHYYTTYGTTLGGLMAEHGLEPTQFLDVVHDIDHSQLEENLPLRAAIDNLPGHKYVLTNGSYAHAQRVSDKLGITDVFAEIFDIAAVDFQPKPAREAYQRFFASTGAQRQASAMFEDLAKNLRVPHEMGLTTTLVVSPPNDTNAHAQAGEQKPDHVHHVTDNLVDFLVGLT
ncbi:MAG: pyrimidine 5'-nucleotidase [Alphaproteobacteria bacterium]